MRGLTAVVAAITPAALGAPLALAEGPPRVVGCSAASLAADLAGVKAAPEVAEPGDDRVEEDQQPKIVGSIRKPRGVSEDDSKKLESMKDQLGISTTPEQAAAAAMAVVADPAQRTVRKVKLEGENGYVIWSVKTVLNDLSSGPDQKLEAKVDAGGSGAVLSIECEPDDD